MIQVSVKGGNKKQRKLIETAVLFGIQQMLPRFRVITIDLVIGRYEHSGLCKPYPNYGRNMFEVEIDRDQDLDEMVKTVFHEMTHVKQFCRKEWQVTGTTPERCRSYWLGSDHTLTPYYRQPWEIEARWMQDKLYREFTKIHKIR